MKTEVTICFLLLIILSSLSYLGGKLADNTTAIKMHEMTLDYNREMMAMQMFQIMPEKKTPEKNM